MLRGQICKGLEKGGERKGGIKQESGFRRREALA